MAKSVTEIAKLGSSSSQDKLLFLCLQFRYCIRILGNFDRALFPLELSCLPRYSFVCIVLSLFLIYIPFKAGGVFLCVPCFTFSGLEHRDILFQARLTCSCAIVRYYFVISPFWNEVSSSSLSRQNCLVLSLVSWFRLAEE